MIRKILSSGRTGAELAALDVAIKLGLAHGGWAQRGMRNEAGSIEKRYGLTEVVSVGFKKAMEENVINSDGTLLISRGEKTVESQYVVEATLRHNRQFLHVDLSQHSAFEAASLVSSWVSMNHVLVAFITGPTDRQDSMIYRQVKKILETAFYLEFVKTGLHPDHHQDKDDVSAIEDDGKIDLPRSVDEAVNQLKIALPLKDRTVMANMQADELDHLKTGLGEYIKQKFGLYAENPKLFESCAKHGNLENPIPDEACAVILRALWRDLRSTHKLRVIK
jgi:hypothetical protein